MSSISDDDDSGPTLKELVTKNLEANGILGKLQAQLRASVFLILEEEFQEKNIPLVNEKTHQQLNTRVGKIALSIIQDFLQCLNLDFTLAVFSPETKSILTESKLNRQYLSKELGRNWKDNLPVLFQLIEETPNIQNNETDYKDSTTDKVDTQPKTSSNSSISEESISEKQIGFTKFVDKTEKTVPIIPSVLNENENPTLNHPEAEVVTSEKENSQKDLHESSESKNVTKNDSIQSVTNGVTKTSSSNSSSSSPNSSKNESSNHSTVTSNHKSEKNTLSGIEKEYEEEFSSVSELKNETLEDSSTTENDTHEEKEESNKEERKKSDDKTNNEVEESEIEEAVETAEDIEEDISSLDDLLSSNSEISNKTKDITISKENDIGDYEETL